MSTFIFGHKNPDTDTVVSSIALSYLLNEEGKNTIPKVLGHINQETAFVLNYFGVTPPDYLNDTKVRIKDIKYNKRAFINEQDSIYNAFNFMQKQNITAIPLVDSKKQLKGLVTLKEIAKYLINGNKEEIDTTYDNILASINGTTCLKFDDNIVGRAMVASYQSKTFQEEVKLTSKDILIVGDRYKIIEYALKSKVKLIILTGSHVLPLKLYKLAQKNKVNVIISSHNSLDTATKIILSNKIISININTKPIMVHNRDYRTDFISLAHKIGHTNYPVVNSKMECLGLIKVTSIDNYTPQDVILVDHNSLSQSAIGIEEANIVEIIDHHNLANSSTTTPINFHCMPVGCTSTIIYNMFKDRKVTIPKHIAGLMLSAILSDTLIFKSPTTTEDDIFAATKLAKLAKVKIDDYAYLMFKASSSVKGLTPRDLINQDFKTYSIGNASLGISQVITMDFEEIKANMDEYIKTLDEIKSTNYLCVVLFITDIYQNGSYVIYNSNSKNIIAEAFDLDNIEEGTFIPELVSRKKQMLPSILEVMNKRV